MNITVRLIVSLIVIITSITLLSTYFVVSEEKAKQYEELDRRASLLLESIQELVEPHLVQHPWISFLCCKVSGKHF